MGRSNEEARLHLESLAIESRPVWKPMHLEPLYQGCDIVDGKISEGLFDTGLCLPSGSSLSKQDHTQGIDGVIEAFEASREG